MVHFSEYIYNKPFKPDIRDYGVPDYKVPCRQNGKWAFVDVSNRAIDKEKFEGFKTRFYELQGWDPASGFPTAKTLSDLGLDYVAKELDANGKLGKLS